jgi:hypothetical protein
MNQDRAGLGTQAEKDIVRSGWCSLLLVRRLDGYVPLRFGNSGMVTRLIHVMVGGMLLVGDLSL